MSKAHMGAIVMFCGHEGHFIADVYRVGNVNVIRANGPISGDTIIRKDLEKATHHVSDFPLGGFWRPDLGVLVGPEKQVKELPALKKIRAEQKAFKEQRKREERQLKGLRGKFKK